MTIILNGGGLPTLERYRDTCPGGSTHLGRLARPRYCDRIDDSLNAGFLVGVDNEAFSSWSFDGFMRMLVKIEIQIWGRVLTHRERSAPLAPIGLDPTTNLGLPPVEPLPPWHPNLLFITVPDVPFDAHATALRWSQWALTMSHLPLALCVQDGATLEGIPWGWPNLRALFMAGSTDYKLSAEMADICRAGKDRGLWIHGGRVNTPKRIDYMLSLGFVDSIDGTGLDLYRDTYLPAALAQVSGTRPAARGAQSLLDLDLSAGAA